MNALPIPINEKWTSSKKALKHFFHSDDLEPTFETKSNKQLPGISYKFAIGAEFNGNDENPDVGIYFGFLNIKENEKIRADLLFRVKSAGFSTSYSTGTFSSGECKIFKMINTMVFLNHRHEIICTKDALFNPAKKFFVNCDLTVEMKGILYIEPSEEIPRQSLSKFLWKNDDRDFILSVGEKEKMKKDIAVHKCVLSSRSPVFDRMLKTNMKEKAEGKVEIIYFNYETVNAAIVFCYDQNISPFLDANFPTNAFSLLQFAEKYFINDLQETIENFLAKSVSPLNIVEITNTAIEKYSTKLANYCFNHYLIFFKQEIPVENMDSLNKEFAEKLQKELGQ
uniref:BTB domain-containing protein n=1 Tax=Panagrolaimus davidi TaxID=227884 RepID=A0A914PM31_9BILA